LARPVERLVWRPGLSFGKEGDNFRRRLAGQDTSLLVANLAKKLDRMKFSFPWHG
jgi:hypothetical protein